MATAGDEPPDYLLIGHLSRDIVEGGERPGGTVLYAGITAALLGKRVGVLTACSGDLPPELAFAQVIRVPSRQTTTFKLLPTPGGRSLRLIGRAALIRAAHIPEAWHAAPLVHLAPIAGEVGPAMAKLFPESRVMATAQGWFRRWDRQGLVRPGPPRMKASDLSQLRALVLSFEDVGGPEEGMAALARRVPIVVLTRGANGYRLYLHGEARDFPAPPADEVDSTGAGDVFAAAFFVRLIETDDPVASGRFAAAAAAMSIEGMGVSRIPRRKEVEARLETWVRPPHGESRMPGRRTLSRAVNPQH